MGILTKLPKDKKIDWTKHAEPPPLEPIGSYPDYMVLFDFLVTIADRYECRMFVVPTNLSFADFASHDLRGVDDPTVLEKYLYPVARFGECLKTHYIKKPFPMFCLTKTCYRRAYNDPAQPALRDQHGRIYFRKVRPAQYPAFTIDDQTLTYMKAWRDRLDLQIAEMAADRENSLLY